MIISQFIFTLFCTVGFCLGLRIVTEEGQILYFLRRPFEGLYERIENIKSLKKLIPTSDKLYSNLYVNWLSIIYFVTKPTIMCITCMASFWGITGFIILNGIDVSLIKFVVLNSFMAAFIQTFIWNLYDKYL